MLVLGIVLIVIGVVLVFVARAHQHRVVTLTVTDLSPIGELHSLYEKVAAEAGKGAFAQRVSVQGTIECAQPLTSELAHTPCVAYRFAVERRWEERYEERDSNGNMQTRTRQGTDTLAENDRRLPFDVRDASGAITVVPDGAHLELEKTVDRFEPGDPGDTLSFGGAGGWQMAVSALVGGRRTLGYHYHEETLPIGRAVYVLGTASDRSGLLTLVRAQEGHDPFFVSLRSREQMIASAKSTMTYTLYAAAGCGALGLILFVVGLISRK